MTHKILSVLPAFRYPNYRIFFVAQIISLIGTWMQMVAQGYLVYQLTHSAFLVGIVAALGQLPATLFSLIGGTIIDRYPKKNVLQITQFLSLTVATFLGILVITNHINLISLTILAFLLGLINAVDQPARLSIVVELVDKKDLRSATAMNMATFNSARIVGPAVAGWLILAFGTGWAFLINGLSFAAPFIAYQFIKFRPFEPKPHPGTLNAIKEGVSYASHHPLIKYLLLYLGAVSIFGWSYVTILPVMSEQVFFQGPSGLGLLFSFAGAGSVTGAFFVSAFSNRFDPKKLALFGGLLFATSLYLFAVSPSFYAALLFLFFSGFGLTAQNATIQATIQHNVDDHVRGRVVSIQTFMLLGLQPLGSYQIGFLADRLGTQVAVAIGAIALFLSAILLFIKTPKKY